MAVLLLDAAMSTLRISGYAHRWGDQSTDDRGYVYRPGCFTKWLGMATGLRLRYDHLDNVPLASIADGSLKLWEDAHGVAFTAAVPSRALPLVDAAIRRGEVGCSLGGVQHLRREDDLVVEAIFHEVSLAPGGGAFPAARVWFENDDDRDLPAHVRAQRGQWRARVPLLQAAGPKPPRLLAGGVARTPSPVRSPAGTATRRPAIDPVRCAVTRYMGNYLARAPW
jgi:phage head maturation protease